MHPDERIARVAAGQHGVVILAQLSAAGLGRRAVAWRLEAGRLRRLHRGVFLVGPVAPPLAREAAAVLACGPTAVLSHASAAELWGLPVASRRAVDVTVPAAKRARRPGISVHRAGRLERAEITSRHGIQVTTPARTLLDLAEEAAPRELERAFDEALVRNLVRTSQLAQLVERHPHRRGAGAARALLRREHGPTVTRSAAEEIMLALVRAARLPRPAVNAMVGDREVDFLWREQRLAVELDSYGFHGRTRRQFEGDYAKTAALEADGFTVLRLTYLQLTEDRDATVARLARALALASLAAFR